MKKIAATLISFFVFAFPAFAYPVLPSITPEMYGAIGDGTTDDTAAIQRALNALGNNSGTGRGGIIEFGTKDYAVNSGPLLVYSNTILQGTCAYQGVWPIPSYPGKCTRILNNSNTDTVRVTDVSIAIRGIVFATPQPILQANINTSGNVTAVQVIYQGYGLTTGSYSATIGSGTGGSNAAATCTVSGGVMTACAVTNAGSGYYDANAGTQAVPKTTVTVTGGGQTGAHIRAVSGVSSLLIENSGFWAKDYCVQVQNLDNSGVYYNNFRFDRNSCYGYAEQGLRLVTSGSQTTKITDNFFNYGQKTWILVSAPVTNFVIDGNNFQGIYTNSTIGIQFNATVGTPSNGVSITNNDIGNMTGPGAGTIGLFLGGVNGARVAGNSFYGPMPTPMSLSYVNTSVIGPNWASGTIGGSTLLADSNSCGNIFHFPADSGTLATVPFVNTWTISCTQNWVYGPNGYQEPFIAVSSTYSASLYDAFIYCNATSGAVTVTLPALASATTTAFGRVYTVIKSDGGGNACTVSGNGVNINGASTFGLASQYKYVTVEWAGSAGIWLIKGSN